MILEFFTKHPKDWEALQIDQTRRGVAYDPGLITALTHQHRQLVMLLVKASSTAEQCYYAESAEALAQFKADLDAHLQRESTQLMPYLAQRLKGEGVRELIQDMHTQHARVGRTVKNFLDRYLREPVDADTLSDFVVEIERVCEEFSQEVEREEASFYTLYMTPEAY
jgi:iron-sulfur cluster repair protein YtfE (RIC family)